MDSFEKWLKFSWLIEEGVLRVLNIPHRCIPARIRARIPKRVVGGSAAIAHESSWIGASDRTDWKRIINNTTWGRCGKTSRPVEWSWYIAGSVRVRNSPVDNASWNPTPFLKGRPTTYIFPKLTHTQCALVGFTHWTRWPRTCLSARKENLWICY